MKKLFILLLLVLFISVHGTGFGDFNIFLQRKIIVGPLENLGEQEDNYLVENLSEQLRLLITKAPFISLTDRERAFLLTLSLGDEYTETFEQTDGKISYRLETVAVLGDLDLEDYPLYVSGNYALHTGQEPDKEVGLKLQIDVYNNMTDTARNPFFIEGNLSDFIDDPQDFLYPFLSEFLRYTIYRMNLTTEPPDALISVDDQLVGIGTVKKHTRHTRTSPYNRTT